MGNAASEAHESVEDENTEKDEEQAVVAQAYAVPHPGTVMVEAQDAQAAVRAMHCAGWTVHMAGLAVLHCGQSASHAGEKCVYTGMSEGREAGFTDLPRHVAGIRGRNSVEEDRGGKLE